jgi:protein-S-isoprenylcysteine O-methyltransferase Ste14
LWSTFVRKSHQEVLPLIVVIVLFILAGSFGTAILLAASGASWTTIALGYVAGGGFGFLIGGVLIALLRWRETRRRP